MKASIAPELWRYYARSVVSFSTVVLVPMAIRVLIVDDQPRLLKGLRELLSANSEWLVCGEASDGLDAVDKAKSLRPDLIIMDISMPVMDGVEATQIIRREVPTAKVLVLSQNDPEILARQAAAADAHGFVAKTELFGNLLATMKSVLAR